MHNSDGGKENEASAGKPKRVRTGCLTCRERHLKCDEAAPLCNNCKKSNRECKRGVRLNFIDTWTEAPPTDLTQGGGQVTFVDESREIASEYQGGLQKYKHCDQDNHDAAPAVAAPTFPFDGYTNAINSGTTSQTLPMNQAMMPNYYSPEDAQLNMHAFDVNAKQDTIQEPTHQLLQQPRSGSTHMSTDHASSNSLLPGSASSYTTLDNDLQDLELERKEFLMDHDETLFMQVFVEEVGIWMDSMDPQKHFSRLLPFHSLSEPMLLNAFLACGARHLVLVNPSYSEEKALNHYDTATRHLLKNLQNPHRDTVICATTAVILNVYEIMSERALQRMNHIAGARALIKECGWNARAQGIGSACFWLNVGLEVLSCLHFNWQTAWDPDDWGLELDFTREVQNGREEVWTQRMLYIVAKVCNFRAATPKSRDPNLRQEQSRLQKRCEEWSRLKALCEAWNEGIPRTMHPMAFLFPYQTRNGSCFPEVWLVKRSTTVSRLFFHTAMLLLAQLHPYLNAQNPDMAEEVIKHSKMICGIVAHLKDRGVASVAIRSLAHAAEVLTDRKEQEEVITIFERINRETGWRIGFVYKELKEKWAWNEQPSTNQFAQTHTAAQEARSLSLSRSSSTTANPMPNNNNTQHSHSHSLSLSHDLPPLDPTTSAPRKPSHSQPSYSRHSLAPSSTSSSPSTAQRPASQPFAATKNPMYTKADFNLPNHPYQNYYVAPSISSSAAAANPANGLAHAAHLPPPPGAAAQVNGGYY